MTSQDEISLRDIALFTRRQFRWLLVLPVCLTILICVPLRLFMRPVYTASALIEIPQTPMNWSADLCQRFLGSTATLNQLHKTALTFDSSWTQDSYLTRTALTNGKSASIIEVSVTTPTPQASSGMANNWSEILINSAKEDLSTRIERRRKLLNDLLKVLESKNLSVGAAHGTAITPKQSSGTETDESRDDNLRIISPADEQARTAAELTQLDLEALNAPRIIVAAESPHMHDPSGFFRQALLIVVASFVLGIAIALVREVRSLSAT